MVVQLSALRNRRSARISTSQLATLVRGNNRRSGVTTRRSLPLSVTMFAGLAPPLGESGIRLCHRLAGGPPGRRACSPAAG
jgi:hypothetical protein